MEKFLFENNVDGMRARELRNLLVQKLGVDPALIARIIDRNELKEMVTSIFHEKIQQKAQAEFTHNMLIATAVVGVLTVLILCRKTIVKTTISVFTTIYGWLGESSYKSAKKVKLMVFNAKRGKYLGSLALGVSILLEIAIMQMQLSMMLSWFVARDHPMRRYFIPTFSFPVSANTLIKTATGGKKSLPSQGEGTLGATISNFGLDIGPMLTVAALNFLVGKLDEYAAGIVLDHVKTREDKKATRKFAKAFGSDATCPGNGTEQAAAGAASNLPSNGNEEYVFEDVNADGEAETVDARPERPVPQSGLKGAAAYRAKVMQSAAAAKQERMTGEHDVPLEFDANLESYMTDESDWLGQQASSAGDGGASIHSSGGSAGVQYESEWLD